LSIAILTLVYTYDFVFFSTPKQKEVFYVPLFLELMMLGAAYALYYFMVPERWCREARFVQLYLTGYIFLTLFLINFYFEASNILYYTLKLNAGNYNEEDDDWYALSHIWKK